MINYTAVYVLWLREMKRYFRARSRVAGTLAMPLFLLAFFGMGFRGMQIPNIPDGVDYINYLVPGIVGIMAIASAGYPDPSAFDPESKYYDPRSDAQTPRWFMVDVRYQRHLQRLLALTELKRCPELAELALVRQGNRLSIMPVTPAQWEFMLALEGMPATPASG